MNVAKRELFFLRFLDLLDLLPDGSLKTYLGAKRIGLLFSSAQIDYELNPVWVDDIPDIKLGDEVFSDGCGLISKRLSIQLSRAKKIIFRGIRYTPVVFQIR